MKNFILGLAGNLKFGVYVIVMVGVLSIMSAGFQAYETAVDYRDSVAEQYLGEIKGNTEQVEVEEEVQE